jgi:hypothetical protein
MVNESTKQKIIRIVRAAMEKNGRRSVGDIAVWD